MRRQSFHDWLLQEVASIRKSLFPLYEKKDRLLYVDAVALRNEYIDKIGKYEESVLEAELETALLREKLILIQTAINRREPVDMGKIALLLEEKRQALIGTVEQQDLTRHELPQLSDEDNKELQRLYRMIVERFHPAINPFLSDTQKELYEKAMEAYQRQNLNELRLITEMLTEVQDEGETGRTSTPLSLPEAEDLKELYQDFANAMTTDYSLAKELYACFAPQEDDTVVLDMIRRYTEQREALEKEIRNIRESFPFNAEATLCSPQKTEEYLNELRIRKKTAEAEKEKLEKRIAGLIGEQQGE